MHTHIVSATLHWRIMTSATLLLLFEMPLKATCSSEHKVWFHRPLTELSKLRKDGEYSSYFRYVAFSSAVFAALIFVMHSILLPYLDAMLSLVCTDIIHNVSLNSWRVQRWNHFSVLLPVQMNRA